MLSENASKTEFFKLYIIGRPSVNKIIIEAPIKHIPKVTNCPLFCSKNYMND